MNSDTDAGAAAAVNSLGRPKRRIWRAVAYLLVLWTAIVGGFTTIAWRPALPEGPTPAAGAFSPALVEHGARLASAGFCVSCHTTSGGKPFGGGYAMTTGFGTIYSTNISPDRATGIGAWTEEAFRRAMREGVARDGSHLFPAFPYDHFTQLSDRDIQALYAFIMTQPPVSVPNRQNEMSFPFGFRPLLAGWKMLFFSPDRFVPNSKQAPLWNRGAYLAEGLSHCSSCHTPRGSMGQELTKLKYQGAPVDGWFAAALTAANESPAPWTADELNRYLTTGMSKYHGTAAGPMAQVTQGIAALTAEDQRALVTYVESLRITSTKDDEPLQSRAVERALAANAADLTRTNQVGGRLFVSACASCHYNRGADVNQNRPDLGLNSAVHLEDPSNLIHVILYGVNAKDGAPGLVMPGFAHGMTDDDVALIASYLRATRSDKGPWPNLAQRVKQVRAEDTGKKP